MSIWKTAEVIQFSDVEVELLTGSDKVDDDIALSFGHPGLKLLLVTLGGRATGGSDCMGGAYNDEEWGSIWRF